MVPPSMGTNFLEDNEAPTLDEELVLVELDRARLRLFVHPAL